MSKRVIMRIELTPAAKDRLTELSHRKGMTQVAVASRLVEWFSVQPETIQAAILGQYPQEIMPNVVNLILEHMAAENPRSGGKKRRSAREAQTW